MSLAAIIGVARGRFELHLPLHAEPGEVIALLGPNGAGKTTALQALAGLVPLTSGRIVVDGTAYDDPSQGRFLLPERRAVGLVPQGQLLFPHLSALDNVAFGARARGAARSAARADAAAWLERLGLETLAGERPYRLSGGQAQRVALARALAVRPRLLLLDEPLAALDVAARAEVRGELRSHLADFAGVTLLVTHEALDAIVLADRLVVLEDGRIVQEGTPAQVARRPRTDYVARLVGLNLLRGRGTGGRVRVGTTSVVVPSAPGGELFVAFAPSAVGLHRIRPQGSARNVWPGRVAGLTPHGNLVRVEVAGDVPLLADVTPAAVAELELAVGVPVLASVKASEIACYPAG